MNKISYKRHRFPPEIIQHAVRLYFRFTLSFRDVKDLLAQRGLDIFYESIHILVTARVARFFSFACRVIVGFISDSLPRAVHRIPVRRRTFPRVTHLATERREMVFPR
jgi:hypothetical protein